MNFLLVNFCLCTKFFTIIRLVLYFHIYMSILFLDLLALLHEVLKSLTSFEAHSTHFFFFRGWNMPRLDLYFIFFKKIAIGHTHDLNTIPISLRNLSCKTLLHSSTLLELTSIHECHVVVIIPHVCLIAYEQIQ